MPCTASGPLAAIRSASSRARVSACPSGTTWPTRPRRSASMPVIGSPISMISMALVHGICRVRRTVVPAIGNRPRCTSVSPILAPSAATRMSVACRISRPPA